MFNCFNTDYEQDGRNTRYVTVKQTDLLIQNGHSIICLASATASRAGNNA